MNNKIYCFSGSHCTGKSTLIQAIVEQKSNYQYYPSSFTDIKKNLDTSLEIKQLNLITKEYELIQTLRREKIPVLKDRGILDTLIYSEYFHSRGEIDLTTYNLVKEVAMELLPLYEKIIIIPTISSFGFVEREKFSMEESSRETISKMFIDFYERNKERLPLLLLTEESLKDRKKTVLAFINNR